MNPIEANTLAKPATLTTHHLIRCAHGGTSPASTWITDEPHGRCLRPSCEFAQKGINLPPIEEDQATLSGVALLSCDGCLGGGRNPHTSRARVCATDVLACAEPTCGYPLHIVLVGATPDVSRWRELGEKRLAAVSPASAAAAAAGSPPSVLEQLYADMEGRNVPIVTAKLFKCLHGGKGTPSTWTADTLISYCRAGKWCDACREHRALPPTPTESTKLKGAALATCPQCLASGRSPNTVRMRTCLEDALTCRMPQCNAPLQIRAIVALADIDRWIGVGNEWVNRDALRAEAEMDVRRQEIKAREETTRAFCQALDALEDIYHHTTGESRELATAVATDWLERNHTCWTRNHPHAIDRLAYLLAYPRTHELYADKCNFCSRSATFDKMLPSVRFCGNIRRHLLRPGSELTVACKNPLCVATECAACRAPPAVAAAKDAAADVNAAIPSIGDSKLLQRCRDKLDNLPVVVSLLKENSASAAVVGRVAAEYLERKMSDAWRAEHPTGAARLVEMIQPSTPAKRECSFCGTIPDPSVPAETLVCKSLGLHLARANCRPTYWFQCCVQFSCVECRKASGRRVN